MLHQPLNIALIGCGAVSQLYYAPALKELEKHKRLRVSALFEPNPANLQIVKDGFPYATIVTSLSELSTQNVDIAIIASPPQFHAQQTIQLLNSGLSVLCEKPMAATVAEAESMIEAARSARGLLSIGLFRRFLPAAQTIHRLLSLQLLGDITSFEFSEGGLFNWPVQSSQYFKKSTAQGGVLIDIGVHLIDLMIWWFGEPPDVSYEDDAMGGIEANCRFQCKFDKGFSGNVRLSRDCVLTNRYLIKGTKGWLKWDVNDSTNNIQLGFNDCSFALDAQIHNISISDPFKPGEISNNFQQSFISQINHLIAAIERKVPLMVSGEQAIQSLKIIQSCYEKRTLMPMPWLNDLELKQAYQLNGK